MPHWERTSLHECLSAQFQHDLDHIPRPAIAAHPNPRKAQRRLHIHTAYSPTSTQVTTMRREGSAGTVQVES